MKVIIELDQADLHQLRAGDPMWVAGLVVVSADSAWVRMTPAEWTVAIPVSDLDLLDLMEVGGQYSARTVAGAALRLQRGKVSQ